MPYPYHQCDGLDMKLTNLPPLEAFRLGVPVLYPDKPGLRDQVLGAALLMDLHDPGTMAEQLSILCSNKELRDELVRAGTERFRSYKDQDRLDALVRIIEDFRLRRSCWK